MNHKYTLLLFFLTILTVYIYGIITDRQLLFSFRTAFWSTAIIPFLIMGILGGNQHPMFSEGTNHMLAAAALIFAVAMYCIYRDPKDNATTTTTIVNATGILSLIGAVAVLRSTGGKMFVQTGKLGFLLDFVFFLPCMFTSVIEYMRYQLNPANIPSVTWTLFKVEAALLLVYFGTPFILDKLQNQGDQLFSGPAFLEKVTSVGLPIDTNTALPFRVSFWIFLKPPIDSSSMKTLMRFGTLDLVQIDYHILKDEFAFRFGEKTISIAAPNKQSWIPMVMDFTPNLINVTMDNKLVIAHQTLPLALKKTDPLLFGGKEMQGNVMNVRLVKL